MASADTGGRPTDLRARRRRETSNQIVDAARCLFVEHGYQATRTEEIARLAGVSGATLFRYFPSKASLALAGVRERIDDALERLEGQPPDLSEIPAAQSALDDFARHELFRGNDPVLAEIALVVDNPELQRELAVTINAAASAVAGVIAGRNGHPAPTLRDRIWAHSIVGAIQAVAELWLDDPLGPTPVSMLGEAFDVLDPPIQPLLNEARSPT